MFKRRIVFVLLLDVFLLDGLISCQSKTKVNQSSYQQEDVYTLKYVAEEIAASGKNSLSSLDLDEESSYLASYKKMLLSTSLFTFSQALYMENEIYNPYNQIVRFESYYDDNSYLNGIYIDSDKTNSTIDIYYIKPENIHLDNQSFYYPCYSLMHLDYDFDHKILGDFYFTNSSYQVIYKGNKVINVIPTLEQIDVLHRKDNTYYCDLMSEENSSPLGKDNDPYYDEIVASFQEKTNGFNELLNETNNSMMARSDLTGELSSAQKELDLIYDLEEVIPFGTLNEENAKRILLRNFDERNFNAILLKESNGKLVYQKDVKALYLNFIDFAHYGYEVVLEDNQVYVKVSAYNGDMTLAYIEYYDYKTLRLEKIEYPTTSSNYVYEYFSGSQQCPVTRDDYNDNLDLLNHVSLVDVDNQCEIIIDGDNASYLNLKTNQYSLIYDGTYYEGYKMDEKDVLVNVSKDESKIAKILLDYQKALTEIKTGYENGDWDLLNFQSSYYWDDKVNNNYLYFNLEHQLVAFTFDINNNSHCFKVSTNDVKVMNMAEIL